MKVAKFGGSSLASGVQLLKVFNIVTADPERKFIVVSAPGKRSYDDEKVTDLLIKCAEKKWQEEDYRPYINKIIARYESIANELQLQATVIHEIRDSFYQLIERANQLPKERFVESMKAAGEDNHAKLVAAFFNSKGIKASYINPLEAGLFVTDEIGNAQVLQESYDHLYQLRKHEGLIIFPGFFGFTKDGNVVTFSRSGSDITGSILANGVKASLYENFTDVDAVCSVNPSIVSNPREIKELTYREMRELSYAGFSVFHDEALIPAFRAGIPVNVKNTNNPNAPGTFIVHERTLQNGPVVGIASDKGFCSIYVSKYLMNREIGFGSKLLKILEKRGISYEHTPSGIDDISVIMRQNQLSPELEAEIVSEILSELSADEVKVERDLALIMIVGEGMRHNVGTTARAAKALADCGVNIEMINQGSSEVSMMFGVKAMDETLAVQALYQEFFAKVLV